MSINVYIYPVLFTVHNSRLEQVNSPTSQHKQWPNSVNISTSGKTKIMEDLLTKIGHHLRVQNDIK